MTVEELRHELHLDGAYGYEGVVITDGVHNFEIKECYHDNGYIEIIIVQIGDE